MVVRSDSSQYAKSKERAIWWMSLSLKPSKRQCPLVSPKEARELIHDSVNKQNRISSFVG
ncbi:unnamed protein product [Prunus armeniaca]|uniref:Uncharacterized protein n=1 Tax=Prunus armeniaca TaxID=36596 RepID=A0A6J5THX4_PRUAR|nr:unnamed protein product [Prunus armeniaca]CAB4294038.1 unnamed protein product [Prunus armeniaca]